MPVPTHASLEGAEPSHGSGVDGAPAAPDRSALEREAMRVVDATPTVLRCVFPTGAADGGQRRFRDGQPWAHASTDVLRALQAAPARCRAAMPAGEPPPRRSDTPRR